MATAGASTSSTETDGDGRLQAAARPPRRGFRPFQRALALLLLVAPLCFAVAEVVLHVRDHPELSLIDEHIHVDYLARVQRVDLPRRGDLLTQEAMHEWACRGHTGALPTTRCGDRPYDPADFFPPVRFSTAYIYFPAYYGVSAAVSGLVDLVVDTNAVDVSRYLGAGWLAAGLLATWCVLRELEFGRVASSLSLVAIAINPLLIHSSSIVNPSAAALLSGAGVMLAVLWWERQKVPLFVPLAASVLAVALATTNFAGVGVAMLYVLWRLVWPRSGERGHEPGIPSRRAAVGLLAGVAFTTLAMNVGWSAQVDQRATVDNESVFGWAEKPSVPIDVALSQLFDPRQPWSIDRTVNPNYQFQLGGFDFGVLRSGVALIGLAAIGGLLVVGMHGVEPRRRVLAMATFVGLLVFGFVFVLLQYAAYRTGFRALNRYSFAALPGFAVGLAVLFSDRRGRFIAVPVLGLFSFLAIVALVQSTHPVE